METLTNFFIFMKTKILKISSLIAIVILALCMLMSYSSVAVFAVTDETTVLDELQSDPDFDITAYEDNAEDFSLQVIQIGEDKDKELYIYTYQPAHNSIDLLGTKVSISYGYSMNGAGLSPKLYDLELVSTSGVFDKYHVKGFTPSKDGDRYYNIVSIYREYNSVVDDEYDETFPTTGKAYSVGQQWYVCDLNDGKYYEMNTFKTMPVDTVLGGPILFKDGLTWGSLINRSEPTQCWIYCFNAEEYQIKHIYDADLTYSIRKVIHNWHYLTGESYDYKDDQPNLKITLADTDVMLHVGSGVGAKDFEWNRILSSDEFITTAEEQGVEFTDEQKQKIQSSQWVFTYLETDYVYSGYSSGFGNSVSSYTEIYYDVYDVGLLRLHFQDFSGMYYDLGVVNDLTDPGNDPIGVGGTDWEDTFKDFWDNFTMVVGLIIGLIFVVVLLNFLPPVRHLFNFLLKGVSYVISLPFQALAWVFKKDGRK